MELTMTLPNQINFLPVFKNDNTCCLETVAPGGDNLMAICLTDFLGLATINMYIVIIIIITYCYRH